jgi:hypothetical protein
MVDRRTLSASGLFSNSTDSVLPGSSRLNGSANVRKPTHLINKFGLGESAVSDNGQSGRSLQSRIVSIICPRMLSEARCVIVVPSLDGDTNQRMKGW